MRPIAFCMGQDFVLIIYISVILYGIAKEKQDKNLYLYHVYSHCEAKGYQDIREYQTQAGSDLELLPPYA